MRVLSLFSGGGLGDYGLELAGMEIVGQIEIDDYCQKILKLRWPDVPKWGDIKSVKGNEVIERCGRIDIISGGFPCQNISTAGDKIGIAGEKSGLWKEMLRIICEIRPRFCFVENVSALLHNGLETVLGDLASVGYDTEWECLPACSFGAPHRRDRFWLVGYTRSEELRGVSNQQREKVLSSRNSSEDVAFATSERLERAELFKVGVNIKPFTFNKSWWDAEPKVGRVAHGIAKRVDRLKLLGNGQVVQVVQWIGERIMEFDQLSRRVK